MKNKIPTRKYKFKEYSVEITVKNFNGLYSLNFKDPYNSKEFILESEPQVLNQESFLYNEKYWIKVQKVWFTPVQDLYGFLLFNSKNFSSLMKLAEYLVTECNINETWINSPSTITDDTSQNFILLCAYRKEGKNNFKFLKIARRFEVKYDGWWSTDKKLPSSYNSIKEKIQKQREEKSEERRLLRAKYSFPEKQRRKFLGSNNYTCVVCKKGPLKSNELQIDHIIPISRGGSFGVDNLQLLCVDCNQSKGTLTNELFLYLRDRNNEN